MARRHKLELFAVLEVSERWDLMEEEELAAVEGRQAAKVGTFTTTAQRLLTPTELSLLKDLALRAVEEPRKAGRENLKARETFCVREELARELGVTDKSYGRICRQLDRKGLSVRREGRYARYNYAMVYRFPTVEEFASALGFEGARGAEFVEEVSNIVRLRDRKAA